MHVPTIGLCPKCLHIRKLTRHHIYPMRFFGSHKINPVICWLCRRCHDKVEKRIPQHTVLPKQEYLKIIREFLDGG